MTRLKTAALTLAATTALTIFAAGPVQATTTPPPPAPAPSSPPVLEWP